MEQNLIVSSSPHIRTETDIASIMRDVVIAMLPAAAAAIIFFGAQALAIMVVAVATAVLTEAVVQKYLLKKPVTVSDWSAVVTGLLLAFNLPPGVPLWMPVVGSVFAIAIAKQCFGGLGQNFVNPALAARAFLLASWPVLMTTFNLPGVDGVTGATPLAILKGTEATGTLPSLFSVFMGNIGGSLGETSALALLVGAAYLFYRKIITWRIPFTYIATVGLLTWILGGKDGLFTGYALYHIFAGGLILGAFYMATDYTTSPVTKTGQIVFGIGCGILTSVIRLYGGYPEGVSYSILLMNVATPLIDRFTSPRRFGEVKARAKA